MSTAEPDAAPPAPAGHPLPRWLKLTVVAGALVFLAGWVPYRLGLLTFWAARWPMFLGSVLVPFGVARGFYLNSFDVNRGTIGAWRNPVVEALCWFGVAVLACGAAVWALGDYPHVLGGAGAVALLAWLARPGAPRPVRVLLYGTAFALLARWLAAALASRDCPPDSHVAAEWCVGTGALLFAALAGACYFRWSVPVLVKALALGGGGALLGGGFLLSEWPEAAWRWVVWFGLVVITVWVVVRWCWPDPNEVSDPAPFVAQAADTSRASQIEYFFSWVFAYPLLVLQLVLLCYISWGGFGEGLGLPDLVWGDEGWMQFWVGLSVSMLFCNALFVRAVLDRRPGVAPPRVDSNWSLFWFVRRTNDEPARRGLGLWALIGVLVVVILAVERSSESPKRWWLTAPLMLAVGALILVWIHARDASRFEGAAGGGPDPRRAVDNDVHQVGAFLLRYWLLALAVFYFPKMVAWEKWRRTETGWMPVGLLTGVAATLVAVAVYEFWGHRRWSASRVFNALMNRSGIERRYWPLHALAAVLTAVIPGIALGVLLYELAFFSAVWSPVWLVCLFLALFNSAYGFVAFHFAGLQYITTGLLVLILIVANCDNEYKMGHPGLEDYYPKCRRPDLDKAVPEKPPFLIDSADLLRANRTKWAGGPEWEYNPFNDTKPKLVIVATTGGGIQASVWTALVLDGLRSDGDLKARRFAEHIRLMTGASGGMQGAGLFAADFENPARPFDAQLARDSLWPTVQTMLTHDLPGALVPKRFSEDRGRRLEEAWWANAPKADRAGPLPRWAADVIERPRPTASPFERTFRDLRDGEAKCERPVLVFSPMLVEDCRRVMISNLSMDWFTATTVNHRNPDLLGPDGTRFANVADPNTISVPALEFWRYFPDAHDKFKVGTAARMSATFPFVGPAVSLPTAPARRVVDAGYFDNFGVNFVAMWLHHHKREVLRHTSGVVVVEIRAYPRREEKLRYKVTQPDGALDEGGYTWALSEFSSPLEAIYNLYARSAYFRNDQLLHMLDEVFNVQPDPRATGPAPLPFFTVATFECPQPAALSWTLPRRNYEELKAIVRPLDPEGAQASVEKGSQVTTDKLTRSRAQWLDSVRFLREWFAGDPVRRKP